LTNKRNLIGRL